MKVLMFGWEYPPHVFGGLATANFGISQGLHAQGDVDITLCLPHPFGDEDRSACKIVAMNSVPIAWRDVNHDYEPGYVFPVPAQLEGANVTIRANGEAVGQGELVSVGDTLGVRLLSWK